MKKLIVLLFMSSFISLQAQKSTYAMENTKPYTILLLLNATPEWLSLSRDQRTAFFEKNVMPLFLKVEPTVEVRLFDSEYFHAEVSDFMIISTASLENYMLLIEMMRDTKIYGVPYFDVKDIIIGKENQFLEFNEVLKNH